MIDYYGTVRDRGLNLKIILCLNPTHKKSWLYLRFFKDISPEYSGRIDNKLYLYSNYKDSLKFLSDTYIKEIESLKYTDPVKYQNQYLGYWLDSDSKALLTKELLDLSISKDDLTNFDKVVVAIDPAVSVNSNSDNTGIAVCGKKDDMYYVIHVEEAKLTPLEWANRAKELYMKYDADFIIYEENQGRINGRKYIKNCIR